MTENSVDAYHTAMQGVIDNREEAVMLLVALESEAARLVESTIDFKEEHIDALSRILATLSLKESTLARIQLIQSCRRHDTLNVIDHIIMEIAIISMRLKKAGLADIYDYSAARYIDDTVGRFNELVKEIQG